MYHVAQISDVELCTSSFLENLKPIAFKSTAEGLEQNMHNVIEDTANSYPHKCTECGKRYVYKSKLDSHSPRHSDEKQIEFTHYTANFKHKTTSVKHMTDAHSVDMRTTSSPEEYNRKCPICSKVFSYPSRLQGYLPVHCETREHTCSVCGKNFIHRRNMLRHKRQH